MYGLRVLNTFPARKSKAFECSSMIHIKPIKVRLFKVVVWFMDLCCVWSVEMKWNVNSHQLFVSWGVGSAHSIITQNTFATKLSYKYVFIFLLIQKKLNFSLFFFLLSLPVFFFLLHHCKTFYPRSKAAASMDIEYILGP